MNRNSYHIIVLVLCVLLIGSNTQSIFAQRNKKKTQSEDAKLREAEFHFTEGEKYFILEDYAKALELFQKSREVNPDNATIYYKIAEIHNKGNNLAKALQNINTALELEKNNKYFYALAADINTQLGEFAIASDRLEQMTSTIDNTDQYLFELAALYLYQQRHEEALKVYNKIEERYGINDEVTTQKQKIFLKINDIDGALNEGQKLIDTYPDEPAYMLKQVEILIANEREDQAIKTLKDYLKVKESADARLVLADLQLSSGLKEEGVKNIEIAFESPELSADNKIQLLAEMRASNDEEIQARSVKLAKTLTEVHPESSNAQAIYGDLLFTLGKKNEALQAYKKALKLDDSNYTLWQNILQILAEQGKADSVILISDSALELFPNQGALYYFNGSANLNKRNYEEAVFALERGKRLSTSNLELVNAFNIMLGDAYNGAEQYKKSDLAFDAVLEFEPDNYAVMNNYSYYLALRGEKLDKAEEMAEKVMKNNPGNPTFADTYAWVLFKKKKYKEAKKVMEKVMNSPNLGAVHFEHFGDILFMLGNKEEAVANWKKAKELNPSSTTLDKKIADQQFYE